MAATNHVRSPLEALLNDPFRRMPLCVTAPLSLTMAVGAYALKMRRVAREARARARAAETRAAAASASAAEASARAAVQEESAREMLELLDTATMLAASDNLQTTLSLVLIRLSDLVPGSACAVFLYDPETERLELAHSTGMSEEIVAAARGLPLQALEGCGDGETRLWPCIHEDAADLGALAHLDPEARSVIASPLHPLPLQGFLGLIYVSARTENGLAERHRQRVGQFARYVAFHIEQKRIQDRFRLQARTDAMTGLDNYRSFRLRLDEETRRARRYGRPLSLILLDIDHFKRINDSYLHVAGDAILRQMAAVLREILRGTDLAARYGGEEMAILCPETPANHARTLAERIRTTVEMRRFALPPGSAAREIGITISLGVATLPTHATSAAILVEQADTALYAAKTAGRNQVCTAGERKPGMVIA